MKLRRTTQKFIEAELVDYRATKKKIAEATTCLASTRSRGKGVTLPNTPGDTGGAFPSSVRDQRHLHEMERTVAAIELVYEKSTATHKRLIEERYWNRPQVLDWDCIAQRLYVSRRQAFNLRGHILQAIAQQMGWH